MRPSVRTEVDGPVLVVTIDRPEVRNAVDRVAAETGLTLWREWARLDAAGDGRPYSVPPLSDRYAGLVLTLAKQEWPDLSAYADPEIVFRVSKARHAGLIVASPDETRVRALLDEYAARFAADFFAFAPAPDRAP